MKTVRQALLLLFFLAFFKQGLIVLAIWVVFAILINLLAS